MKADSILEEVWRVKDKLSQEMLANPDAYFARMVKMEKDEEKAGRKIIRSAAELRQLADEMERIRGTESAMVLNDKPARNSEANRRRS